MTTTTETDTPAETDDRDVSAQRLLHVSVDHPLDGSEPVIKIWMPSAEFTRDELRQFTSGAAAYLTSVADGAKGLDPEVVELAAALKAVGALSDFRAVDMALHLTTAGYKRTGSARGAAEGRQDG